MEAWFISDIHLKSAEERNGQILLRFLRSLLQKDPKQIQLFLLGDIFDLWIGGSSFFVKKFAPLTTALAELVSAGAEIIFIEGNHDVHIEKYFQDKLGIKVYVEAQYFKIEGLTIRVEHGDMINLNDLAYMRYRGVVRHPLVKPLSFILPGSFWDYIGNKASKKSRSISSHYRARNEELLSTMVHAHAERAYLERPFDFIISGHMHIFADAVLQMNGHSIRSVNLGSWLEESVKAFRIKDGQGDWVNLV